MTQLLAPRQTTVLAPVQAVGIEINEATVKVSIPLTDAGGVIIGQEYVDVSVIISDPNIPSAKRTQLVSLVTELARYGGLIA